MIHFRPVAASASLSTSAQTDKKFLRKIYTRRLDWKEKKHILLTSNSRRKLFPPPPPPKKKNGIFFYAYRKNQKVKSKKALHDVVVRVRGVRSIDVSGRLQELFMPSLLTCDTSTSAARSGLSSCAHPEMLCSAGAWMVWRIKAHALCPHGRSVRKTVESTDQPAETDKGKITVRGERAAAAAVERGRHREGIPVCRTVAMLGKRWKSSVCGGP